MPCLPSRHPTAPLSCVLGLLLAFLSGCEAGDPRPPAPAPLTVRFTQPQGDVRTREASLPIEVAVSGGSADRVVLLRDGEVLATLRPPYQFTWDISSLADGVYTLRARAWKGVTPYSSRELSVTVDRTPPALVSRTPASGAADVQAQDPIVLGFSEPLNPQSVLAEGFELTAGGQRLAFTANLSPDGRTLSLTPQGNLWESRDIRLGITQGPADVSGNAMQGLAEPLTWTLAPWQKLPALAGLGAGQHLAVEGNAQGELVVAYTVGSEAPSLVVQRWTGAGWEPVGEPLHVAGPLPERLSLALSPEGHPWLAWIGNRGGDTPEVHAQAWTGTVWQPLGARPDEPGLAADGRAVSIAVSPQGTGYLAADFTGTDTVKVKHWSGEGARWEDMPPLPHIVDMWEEPALRAGPGGPVLAAVVIGPLRPLMGIAVQRWADGAWQSLGETFVAGTAHSLPGQVVLALDAADRPTVACVNRHGSGLGMLLYVHAWNGTSWDFLTPALEMASMPTTFADWPALVVEPSGTPLVSFPHESGPRLMSRSGGEWHSLSAGIPGQPVAPAQLGLLGGTRPVAVFRTATGLEAVMRLE